MTDLLATTDDLATFTGDATLDSDRATAALEVATALVQSEAMQRLVYVEDDTVELPGPFMAGPLLELPERPVADVTGVSVYTPADVVGYSLEAGAFDLVGNAVRLLVASFAPVSLTPQWASYSDVVVTYSHGFDVTPAALRGVVLAVAARTVTNPLGLRSETIGSYSYQLAGGGDATSAGVALSPYEQRVCWRYRRRTFGMVR